MLRIAIICSALLAWAIAPLRAQVADADPALAEQLVPESFKLDASAIVTRGDRRTSVSYALTNNSGMNLYMGVARNSVAIGSCGDAPSTRGGLMLLSPSSDAPTFILDGPPHLLFAPAGGKTSGLITFEDCIAPNPRSPTAPFSMTLMMSQTNNLKGMVQFPVSTTASVRLAPQP